MSSDRTGRPVHHGPPSELGDGGGWATAAGAAIVRGYPAVLSGSRPHLCLEELIRLSCDDINSHQQGHATDAP